MPFSLELPMNTPDWTDVGGGVRESYCPISARSQMLWASLRDAISGRR